MQKNNRNTFSIATAILLAACGGGELVSGRPITTDSESPSTGGGSSAAACDAATGGSEPVDGGGLGGGGLGGEGGAASGSGPATYVGRHGHLRVDGAHLVDQSGAVVQLRGVSSMWLNWENDGYGTNLDALHWMRDQWGLTVIRAAMGVDADGGYATGGKANMLQRVEKMIQNAEEAGVYIIIDWHSHHAEDYAAESVAFFADMSARYGHLPNVLFEPYNEPLAISWQAVLKPYHEAVIAAIRESDTDAHPNVVIAGTPNWDQDVDAAIAAPLEDPNVAYTAHFYSCDHGASYLAKAKAALSAGLAVFVTEWGATKADGGVDGTPVCATEADQWLNWMQQNGVGWAAWKLDNCAYELQENGVEDTSCLLVSSAPVSGGWTAEQLNGHAPYVISKMGCQQ